MAGVHIQGPRGQLMAVSAILAVMSLTAWCTARLDGDELVLTMADGTVHSRIPVDDSMDPAEALERITDGTMPLRLLWTRSHDELDEALTRDGWSRVSPRFFGPVADVVRHD